jgi:chaperonin GroES
MKSVQPIGDKILVKRVEEVAVTKGGIYIPPAAQEKSTEAIVVAVGSGRVLENGTVVPVGVKVGDKVLMAKWAGTEIKLDDVEHLFVYEKDLLGVVTE